VSTEALDPLGSLLETVRRCDENLAKETEGTLELVSSDIADALMSGDREYLYETRREIRRAYTVMLAKTKGTSGENSLEFVLGRLAGLYELLAIAANRRCAGGTDANA